MLKKNVRMLCPDTDSLRHESYMINYITTRKPKVLGKGRNVVGMMADGTLVPLHLTLTEQVRVLYMMFLTVCTKVLANNDLIFTGILRPLEESEMQSSQHQNKSVMVQERDMIAMLPVRLFV
jgi:hypothetical protein